MPVKAIDNTNLIDYRGQQPQGFVPALAFSVSGSNVTITNSSTIPAGDSIKAVRVRLHDRFGGEVRGFMTSGGSGYTSAPTVSFSGGGGTGAAATSTLATGTVGSVDLIVPTTVVLSSSTLNTSKPLDITATITTTNMIAADGGAYNIGAAGSLANWDTQQNA